jgi:integrase/recombinase XerD
MNFVAILDHRPDKHNEKRILIRCRFEDKKQRFFNTQIKCTDRQWSKKRRRVINNDLKNRIIEKALLAIQNWKLEIIASGMRPTAELFDDWNSESTTGETFNDFYYYTLENDNTMLEASKRSQRRTLELIGLFKQNIRFDELNRKFVIDFHNFISGYGFAQNTLKSHHKNLKKFINAAITAGKISPTIDTHPYRGFSISAKPSDRVHLTDAELKIIREKEMKGTQARVRDLFLFSCDTGMRFSDTQGDGIRWTEEGVEYSPEKTQKYTGLVRVPFEVMQYPEHVQACKGKLIKISNPEANRYLKSIMIDCELDKLLTFHVSRHTFCTNVARKTGNLFKLMKYAGLRKTDTAMIYIHLSGV